MQPNSVNWIFDWCKIPPIFFLPMVLLQKQRTSRPKWKSLVLDLLFEPQLILFFCVFCFTGKKLFAPALEQLEERIRVCVLSVFLSIALWCCTSRMTLKIVEFADSKLGTNKDFHSWISAKIYLPLMMRIHNINSNERCVGWLYICFTCEICSYSSINKIATIMVATFLN